MNPNGDFKSKMVDGSDVLDVIFDCAIDVFPVDCVRDA